MAPIIKESTYVYVELCGLLSNKDIGIFKFQDQILIRRLIYKRGKFVLRADNKEFDDIQINNTFDFQIIGKIYV